jgi:hypothetical protein
MARTDPIDMIFDIIKIAAASIIGFIIIKALLQVALGS